MRKISYHVSLFVIDKPREGETFLSKEDIKKHIEKRFNNLPAGISARVKLITEEKKRKAQNAR